MGPCCLSILQVKNIKTVSLKCCVFVSCGSTRKNQLMPNKYEKYIKNLVINEQNKITFFEGVPTKTRSWAEQL
jgi:hypothetical protein